MERKTEDTRGDVKRFQGCINDLISLQALPSIWTSREPAHITSTLLEALVRMLRLDFAYSRVGNSRDGSPIEVVRFAHRHGAGPRSEEVGVALSAWLTNDHLATPLLVPNPIGDGKVSIVAFRVGLQQDADLLVAGSGRSDFPTTVEMLLLRVAVNQAAIALQEARQLTEQARAVEEIERQVAERTNQLTAEVVHDITQRERAEAELRQSEERFRLMVESVKDYAIYMLDPQGRILTWNTGAEHIKGYRAEEAISRHYSMFYTREDVALGLPDKHLEIASREGQLSDEGWRLRKDGTRFWGNVVITAMRDRDHNLIGFSKVTRDLTERRRAEAHVAYQANLLANIHDAVFATDDRLNLTAWNRAAEELYGWKAEEVLGLKVQDVIRSEISATQRSGALKILAETGHYHAEAVQYRREGWPLWIQGDTMVLRDEAGQITGYVCAFRDVTKRKKAEAEALALKDELAAELTAMTRLHELSTRLLARTELQPLLEEVLDATIALLNADFGNIQLYNTEAEALEIVVHRGFQQDFLDYFSSVDEDDAVCGLALKLRGPVIVEDVQTDPGFASHRQIAASAGFRAVLSMPLFSRSGEPLGMLSAHFREPHRPSERDLRFTDLYAMQAAEVIERKRAEQELRRSEAYLAEAQTLSHTASWAWNASTGESFWSQELFRIYGLDPEQMKPGHPSVLQFMHPEDRARAQETFENAVRKKSDYELAYRVVWPDGTIRHVNNLAHPVFDESGTLIEYVGMTIDTTERKLAEEELRRSEAHLAEAQRIAHIGSWIWHVDTGECYWSQEHFRIFGLDPETFRPTAKNTQKFIHPEDLPYVQQTLEHAIREREEFEVEYRLIRPDGSTRYHRGLGRPLVTDQGDLKFIGMAVDITERKLAEDALREAQAELAHATRVLALGELTAAIAHEVNQPLSAIVTNGQASLRLLSREIPDLEGTREAVEAMVNDGIRAGEVVKRIRALMKKSISEKAPLNINETIREVITLSAVELFKNRVSLRTDLEADLPPVLADRVQIQQVVLNLVLNANEAMTGIESRPKELFIGSKRSVPDQVMVLVRDSGNGIDPNDYDRIFDAFFTTKTKAGGLGLGLSISRTIIEAHGGKVWATPGEGDGATFRFTLPTSDGSQL
jgi:PAS domain S-box-containing protein